MNNKPVNNTESIRVDRSRLAHLRNWKGVYGNLTELMDRGLELVIQECRDKDVKINGKARA